MKIPKHVGIIMDGNRRWAKNQGLKIFKGHDAGVERIESTVMHAEKQGIAVLSLWAFSTDNWSRSGGEVRALMRIFNNILTGPMVNRLIEKGVKITMIGDMSRFPKGIQKKAKDIVERSAANKKITVNLGLNYGGREEIVFSVNQAFKEALKEGRTEITEEDISSHLYTKGQPEPDLMIRTSGEERHSGFLLWQSKNTEYYYSNVNWPDFNEREFDKALQEYASRQRRFGK